MGWTGIFDAIRKSNGTIDRKATLEREFSGWTSGENKTTMLKGSMAGSVFYAAMETTTPAGREVWALVVLTSTNGAEFCYKDMDETCGPCEASCPVSILDALTPTTNETANAWRQRCRENLEKKKAAAGRIPRNATQLYITFLRDTTASRAGESVMVYKIDGAWIYTSKTGGRWRLTAALLRNDDFIRINGTEEPTPEPLPEEVTANAQEAPTTEETSEAAQDTTCTDKEPQEGTETVQKTTDMATFCAAYRAAYTALYDHCGEPETDKKERYYCTLFDQEAEAIADIIRRFCVYRGDLLTSDREAAAFMKALETVGTPTDGKTATDGETTTTTETDAQRATETARTTADDTTPTATQTEPPRAAERDAGSVSQSDRRTRPAAPQSHESGEGIQRHHRPPKTAYRAIQRAATIPARYHHAQTTTSRGSPKICISWG